MSDLHELSATEQLSALRAGRLSATELLSHYLERIEERDASIGAFLTLTPELALEEARAADCLLRSEEVRDLPRLLGLPVAVKDLHATAGVRTTYGSAALADHVPIEDDWAVGLIRRAGAVLVGKTNVPEFGLTCYTENSLVDRPAVTPWDVGRYASGSSGGSAAAVAAGLVPVAHASDGAGSTRTPASVCGLVGVKPTRGLVSEQPAASLISMAVEGPIARTVDDAALLLDVMSAPAPGQLYTPLATDADPTFLSVSRRPPGRLTVGAYVGTGLDGVLPHPDAVAAVEHAVATLTALGHSVHEIAHPAPYGPDFLDAVVAQLAAMTHLMVEHVVPKERQHLLRPFTTDRVRQAARMTAGQLASAQHCLSQVASRMLAATQHVDVLLSPTVNGPAVPLGYFEADGPDHIAERMLAWSPYTPPANLAGNPAVTLPLWWNDAGLPVGIQIAAAPGRDGLLLSLAHQLEQADAWSHRHPKRWDA